MIVFMPGTQGTWRDDPATNRRWDAASIEVWNILLRDKYFLSGKRDGQWSIRINDQWRLCFRFEQGDAFDIEIVDYH